MRSVLLAFIATLFMGFVPCVQADKGVYKWAFIRLDYARDEKAVQLAKFCDAIHKQAAAVKNDEVMLDFFDTKNKYYQLAQAGPVPDNLTQVVDECKEGIRKHYVDHYMAFYDILFINTDGSVFYTIRRESDYHQNIFQGELGKTKLSRHLRKKPQEDFVDFEYFPASDEPGAFFVQPAYKGKELMGWFVLQWAINKINSLFAGCEQLGPTGETFLVNKEQYLLTESGFVGDSTILKMHLDSGNIESKFREKNGHRIITDYRGFRAVTSFKVFPFLGTEWLIVAKIDEAQIITDHFSQHQKYHLERIANHLSTVPLCKGNWPKRDSRIIMVDMDEFVKAHNGELLQTVGVSTCTALIATYPGKFGYMAHISPYDKVYGIGYSNLVGRIITKIKTYDIYKYERRYVRFIIVAKHLDSLNNIVEKLVNEGFLLSQINVLHHPEARCANVIFDYSENLASAEWLIDKTLSVKTIQNPDDSANLGTIVKQLLNELTGK